MSRQYCSDKDINALIVGLVKKGWSVSFGGRHPKLYAPDRSLFVCYSISPSDPGRSYLNLRAFLRRHGMLGDAHP